MKQFVKINFFFRNDVISVAGDTLYQRHSLRTNEFVAARGKTPIGARSLMGPKDCLKMKEKRKISRSYQKLNSDSSVVQPVA